MKLVKGNKIVLQNNHNLEKNRMMESDEDEKQSKLNDPKKILEEHGFDRSDLEKLKEKKFDEISEETDEILKNVGITTKEMRETFLGEISHRERAKIIEKSKKISKRLAQDDSEEAREETLAPREEIAKFLRERSMSQSFINTFLKLGYTEEFRRLLNAMGFTFEETEELRKLWESETECPHEIDSSASLPSSSNEYLSSDSLYLKHLLSKPLVYALRDVITRKPFDPVEYLGHWLLNYKICEERETRKKEFELELMIERERTKLQKDEEEKVSVLSQSEEDEEEFFDDWIFVNDEELEIS